MAAQLESNATNSAVGQTAIQADIHAYTSNSLAITKTFQEDIASDFFTFDRLNIGKGTKFGPQWQSIIQNLINALVASRNQAATTAAYCTQITTATLPFAADLTAPIPVTLSVEALTAYIAIADSLGAGAQAASQAFTTLSNSINALASTLQTIESAQQASSQNAYNQQIAISLNTKLPIAQRYSAGQLAEAYSGGVASIGITFQRVLGPLSAANSTLQSMGFSAIWSAVKSDCTSVSNFLKTANTPIVRQNPQIFWETLNNVHSFYTGIAQGLTLMA
ncbi:hypothetical protein B0H16DRAFT_1457225 [Mycena metata]|uniref:Uncharacterized protein n=1 Tax=Mycena metata TaxID=1033252 RepID=A0AAD7JB88_9AGAR|nr:hypothetical protein B0H16DRAFT_1457225 [Mycena metata]